ncbi:TIGR03750 family conjugal transfer protein [Morganella morganii]|nr:TIGR03750 family conjugal transfer protein [Morganella morganii]
METIDFMPDRLNAEPTVFRGFTTYEMFAAAGVGFVGGMLMTVPLLPLAGWVIIPTGALIMPLIVVFFGGKFLIRFKRGKPENYLYRRLSLKLQTGFAATLPFMGRLTEKSLITVSQGWFLRRTQPVSLYRFLSGGWHE